MKAVLLGLLALAACDGPLQLPGLNSGSGLPAIRGTLTVEYDGKSCTGTCVIPRQTSRMLTVRLPEKTRVVVVRSCHRHQVFENPPTPWKFNYVPAFWVENRGACPMFIRAIRADGKTRLAVIEWKTDEELQATMYCNAERVIGVGSSLCQISTGLEQNIWFDEDTDAIAAMGCSPIVQRSARQWSFFPSKGLCVYAFQGIASGKLHRLVTWGYDDDAID